MSPVNYFEIQASHPSAAIQFYQAVFGWTFVKEIFTPMEYYRIEGAGIYGGLLHRPAVVPPPGSGTNAYVCSMRVESFDQTAEAILQAGGQVALPKFAIPGRCWQGYFLDTDSNTFGIFEVDEAAR